MSDLNKSAPQSDDDVTGIAAYFIRNRVISWMVALIFLIGGIAAFFGLGRLEDPAFTIKQVKIYTAYPGASAEKVEREITERLEIAIQQMPQLKEVTSISSPERVKETTD